MATREDLRRICLSLPGAHEAEDGFVFFVLIKGKEKGFIWHWRERVHPKKAKVTHPDVVVLRVRNLSEKEILLNSDRRKFFTEAHYDGYPAVLCRLSAIDPEELGLFVMEAWRRLAPAELVKKYEVAGLFDAGDCEHEVVETIDSDHESRVL